MFVCIVNIFQKPMTVTLHIIISRQKFISKWKFLTVYAAGRILIVPSYACYNFCFFAMHDVVIVFLIFKKKLKIFFFIFLLF